MLLNILDSEYWDGTSRKTPKTDENGVFLISTGSELAWFADYVNAGNTKINGKLVKDIALNKFNTTHNWVIIGDSIEHAYQGFFDGNGHTVGYLWSEISSRDTSRRYVGLFGIIDGGIVKNLSVSGNVIHGFGTYGKEGAYDELYTAGGGIAGYLKSGKIIGCENYAKISADEETMYRNNGGIVGINSGIIMRCTNYGRVLTDISMAQRHIGGIAGIVYGGNASIWYCENRNNIQGYFEVGGIAGAVKNGGEIQSSTNFNMVSGASILGGIAGNVTGTSTYSDGTQKECKIKNTYNLGAVQGHKHHSASEAGGIVGILGYENWKEEGLPSRPIVENSYSTAQFDYDVYSSKGGIVGLFKSGVIGNVYALACERIKPCGYEENKSTSYSGTVQMKTATQLKSRDFVKKELGSPFAKASKRDPDTKGYPKLVWQMQDNQLIQKIDEAILELEGWLSLENQKKYGSAYTKIENTVKKYQNQLESVTSEQELMQIMEEARNALKAIKPSQETDTELGEAIDNGIIALGEYKDQLLEQNVNLTEAQIKEIENLTKEYVIRLEKAKTLDEVKIIIRDGKDCLDGKIAEYNAEKRFEEIQANALKELENYRVKEEISKEWLEQIEIIRKQGLESIKTAQTVADIVKILKETETAIDEIINQIPEEGAWDGVTLKEPIRNEQGVYEIVCGAELAWFADQVNNHVGQQSISGILHSDISLGNQNWNPIGDKEIYRGNFDGNGYTIRGLNVIQTGDYAGLFGAVYGGATQTICNITVEGTIKCSEKTDYAGGIVGYIYGKNPSERNAIINCHSKVNITLSKVKKNGSSAGGIAGYAKYTWFRQCSNVGSVVIDSVGKGGIQFFTGGLIGNTDAYVSVRQSYNAGYVSGSYCAGGLIGKIGGQNSEFTSNYNCGETLASTYSGGLAGVITGSADGSQVNWCYSSGPVNVERSGEYLGALFGGVRTGKFHNLYAWKRPDQIGRALVGFSADATAPGTFLNDVELRSDAILNGLNGGGSYFIKDYLGFQNDFPILSWQLTLEDLKTGAIAELQNYAVPEDYLEENWLLVQEAITVGIQNINNGVTMDDVKAALTDAKAYIDQVESKEDALIRELEEKKTEVLAILDQYVDLSLYREAEQIQINKYLTNARKLIIYAETIEAVERYLIETKENIDALPTMQQYEYEQNLKAAQEVDNLINSIGEVIWADYVKISINKARIAYDALTEGQKALVSLYQTLLDAEEEYQRLAEEHEYTEEDEAMAFLVDELILAVGEVTVESGDVIREARYAYDGLTEIQKSLVKHPEILVEAEKTYDELRAAEVSARIASIGDVTLDSFEILQEAQNMYDDLTEKQKALVTDYEKLVQAFLCYENLQVAQAVMDMIDSIGEVSLDSKTVILETIHAYNSLTGEQQKLVHNYHILDAAMAKYDSLNKISYVEQLIASIGVVSTSSGTIIQEARNEYGSLSEEEKSQVSNLEVLESAEAAYEALLNPPQEEKPSISESETVEEENYEEISKETYDKFFDDSVFEPVEKVESKTESSSKLEEKVNRQEDTGEDTVKKEDSSVEWSEYKEEPEDSKKTGDKEKQMKKLKKQKKEIEILGGILGILGCITVIIIICIRKADKQRKRKEVHFE